MNKTVLSELSERQRPHAIQVMEDIYASHIVDPSCGLGESCPLMVDLKKRIEDEKQLLDRASQRP